MLCFKVGLLSYLRLEELYLYNHIISDSLFENECPVSHHPGPPLQAHRDRVGDAVGDVVDVDHSRCIPASGVNPNQPRPGPQSVPLGSQ